LLANFSNETIVVPKATVLGVAEEISESLIDRINPKCKSELDTPVIPQRQKKNEAFYGKLLQGMLDHLSQDEGQLIERILLKYTHVFHDESTNDFKRTDFVEYQILVGDTPHISRPQYCTPYALRQEMEAKVEIILNKGIIKASISPWSAPAILVSKKTTDGIPKYRFCVDFRALNAATKFDPYPLPVFEETTSILFGSKYFSVLDCYSRFWQVPIKEEHKKRTGFTVPQGHYELVGYRFDCQTVCQISNDRWT